MVIAAVVKIIPSLYRTINEETPNKIRSTINTIIK